METNHNKYEENVGNETEETVGQPKEEQEEQDQQLETSEEEGQSEDNITPEQEEIAHLTEQLNELENRMVRTQADYDNFRRRTREEKAASAKYRSQSLVEEILPVLDNFERAFAVQGEGESYNSLLQGMEMVYRQLKDALLKEGVEEIDAVGQPFDPHKHQAVMQVETNEYESDVVAEVLQKGYMLKDKVIRPAMVKVSS
ncbi:nucleotide exchange factor GrpE [Pseudalkalibacillus caeni]|uniref:Protein GrpE n=1 Tax=Exobacillus caeni TaxID=2574798 RepID=A0A5R9FCF8_9BACL|nr:nucleotide exchange factor GrpE [Pseudalkalibacillus caeni]TLS39348.1 nucleotide exchange factor GrpE [Pseudalkalibacillus caeni]